MADITDVEVWVCVNTHTTLVSVKNNGLIVHLQASVKKVFRTVFEGIDSPYINIRYINDGLPLEPNVRIQLTTEVDNYNIGREYEQPFIVDFPSRKFISFIYIFIYFHSF